MTNLNTYLWEGASSDLWLPRILGRAYRLTAGLRREINSFWNSRAYFTFFCVASALFYVCGFGLAGAGFLILSLCAMLVFCEDLLASVLPMMLTCLVTMDYYSDYTALLRYWWMAIPLAAALIFHLSVYARPMRRGKSFRGCVAVSIATMLGGIGTISAGDYLSKTSVYYMLGLGVGLVAVYLLVKSQIVPRRNYDVVRRFAEILYFMGLFAGLVVAVFYLRNIEIFIKNPSVMDMPYRNYCTTLLLIALPMPWYFALKNGRHIWGGLALYAALLLTGSRSGMVFGTLLMVVCALYFIRRNTNNKRAYLVAFVLTAVPFVIFDVYLIKILYTSRMIDGVFISLQESRIDLILCALRDFIHNPIFGAGLGNTANSGVFSGTPGSMIWYHNWFAQVIGSMGLVGVFAYGLQLRDRILIFIKGRSPIMFAMGAAYAGIFLMSMTNPGEFCPVPNGIIVVLLFALAEDRAFAHENKKLKKT